MRSLLRKVGAVVAVALAVVCGVSTQATPAAADVNYSKTVHLGGIAKGDTVNVYKLVSYGDGMNSYEFDPTFKSFLDGADYANGGDIAKYFENCKNNSETTRKLMKAYVNTWTNSSRPALDQSFVGTAETQDVRFGPGYYLVLPTTTGTNARMYSPLTVFVKVNGNESTITVGGQDATDAASVNAELKSASGPSIEKFVVRSNNTGLAKTKTVEVGEEVKFAVKITVPAYGNNEGDPGLVLNDTLNKMAYDNGGVKVYAADTNDGLTEDNAHLLADVVTVVNDGSYVNGSQELEIPLDYSKMNASGAEKTVYVVYAAIVQPEITDEFNEKKLAGTNSAYVSYLNTADLSGTPAVTNRVSTTVYSYAVNFTKLDQDNDALTGAKFKVANDKTGDDYLWFVKKGTGADAYYVIGKKTDEGATQEIAADAGNANNEFNIRGLDSSRTYYVTESTTPEGYYAPAGKFKFTITSQKQDADNNEHTGNLKSCSFTAVEDSDGGLVSSDLVHVDGGKAEIALKNTTTPSLPTTGGMGTAIFTVAGVVLMTVAAGAFFFLKKRNQ